MHAGVSHKRVAILISGSGSNMVALVQSMTGDHPARPVLVLSDMPEAGGLARARALSVPTFVVDRKAHDRAGFEAELTAALTLAHPDTICLAGFMRVLSPGFVDHWAGRILNIHPSLLPKYPGLHTHAAALANGDSEHGCSVHVVTPVLDGGPILGQARMAILPGDTPETLAARLLPLEHTLYPAVLRRFAMDDRTPVMLAH